jgi:hypothetical protein
MSRIRFARVMAAIAAAALGAGLVVAPSAASAAVVTTIDFETQGPVTVGFGDDWFLRLSVTSSYDEGPTLRLGPNDGTVDVYFSGVGGIFAAALPIQPDGLVYVSQPTAQPLLAAGEYEVSAIYNPAPGGYYGSSQTATPLSFTVTALDVVPTVEVVNDPAVSERPIITASLGGSYVDSTGGAPAGTWHFIVTTPDDQPVFDETVAQLQGATEPLRIEIDSKLEKGASYTVMSAFTPVDELAGGVTVGTLADTTFQTPGGTPGEAISAPVPMPLWLAIALLVVLLGLAAAAITIGVKLARRSATAATPATGTPAAPQRVPGDPYNVELGSLNDLGLPDPETIPELRPEGETKRLPVSTTWLLSDVEPATGLPDFSEAPTERLDAISSSELTAKGTPSDAPDLRDATEGTPSDDDKAEE